MSEFDDYQRRRWMRPNAHLYIRHDAYRFMPPGSPVYVGEDVVKYFWPDQDKDWEAEENNRKYAEALAAERAALLRLKEELTVLRSEIRQSKALPPSNYDPNQPRVPAGNDDGGQWTRVAGPGGGRGPSRTGRFPNATPGQQARLAVADARAQDALRRVREIDPNWRPNPGIYGTGIESEILKANDLAQAAQARVTELARVGIGPGPFAHDSIAARSSGYSVRTGERDEINRIGREFGCHTCGAHDSGTMSGNFVRDHQPPNAWNPLSSSQRIYPHCATCSARQGNWLSRFGRQ